MEAVGRNGFLDLAESERRLCVGNSLMNLLFHSHASNPHGRYVEDFNFNSLIVI